METREILSAEAGQVLGTVTLPAGTPEEKWELALTCYLFTPAPEEPESL